MNHFLLLEKVPWVFGITFLEDKQKWVILLAWGDAVPRLLKIFIDQLLTANVLGKDTLILS